MFSTICRICVLLNVVLFFREAELQPITFIEQPTNPLKVVEGNNIFLQWSYVLVGSVNRIELLVDGNTILEYRTPNQRQFIVPAYENRIVVHNITDTESSITIVTAKKLDSVTFQLKIVLLNGSRESSLVVVEVQYPPEFTTKSGDQNVVEGDVASVTLECIADGKPPPNITWTKVLDNGSDSNVLSRENTFVLDNNRNNTGTYRCTAYNGIGTAPNHTVNVNVDYKPEKIQLIVNDSNICQGDVISITCSADGKPVVHTYQLFENDIPVSDGSSSTGVWSRTMSTQGVFTYRCVANNTVGTSNKNVTVTVNVPSVVYPLKNITVTEGENRNLTCNVSGSAVSVTWTAVSSGNRSMGITRELTHISRNDSGEYKCEASNSCGNDTASTFLTVHYKPENFQFTASESNVCKGDMINFTCSADGNPAVHTYQLFKNDTAVSDGSNSDGRWSRTMSTGGVFIYKCMANNTVGTGYSAIVTITVNEPSSIPSIQDKPVTEGSNVTLTCQASGMPHPMVSWIKPGGQRSNGSVLVLTNVNRGEAGEYRCEASNQCGNASEAATVDVQYKPENVKLVTSAADNKACRGDVISLNCSAGANPSVTSFQLLENDTAISDTSGRWIKNFTSGGVFIYKCVANNTLGTEHSQSVSVTINEPSTIDPIHDQIVTEGGNVTLTCQASGMPHPMMYWIKPGGQRSVEDVLVLTNINRSEAGEYRCEASNQCGNASEAATVDVQYKPGNVQLVTSAADNKACQGDVISLNCSADANPSVMSYQLFENDTAILNTSGRWIKNFISEGVFIYKCVANNTLGTEHSQNVTVNVNVPSSIQSIQAERVKEGGNVTLTCQASGMPHPVVSWIKPGGQRSNGSVLVLTNINRSEAGDYMCEASNQCGNALETATVDVQYQPGNVQLVTSAADNKACQGDVISLNCSAYANPPVTSYQLLENDTAILDTSGSWSKNFTSGGVFIYKCVANNTLGTDHSQSVNVTVNVPSTITAIQDKSVTEGDNVTLTCQASGMPHPMVSWIKPGGQRSVEDVLVLTNINRSEAGEYRCEASNQCGNASEAAVLDVQYKPGNVQLVTSAADNKACQGIVISLNCSADANPSVTSYQLLENDTAILDTSGSWSKNFTNGGVFIYKCVANNTLGTEHSQSVTVTVNVPSSIQKIQDKSVTEGDNVTLTCQTSGMPHPTVSWIKPGGQRSNGSVLVLTNINRSEAGEYMCEASNQCGHASEATRVYVQYKPENVQLETSAADNKACRGDVISLNCSADANPSVTSYQLLENDTAILDTSGRWRKNFTSGGVFIYKCVANNTLGTEHSQSVTVTVNVPSTIQQIQDKTVTEGGNVTLTCQASGMPHPMVSWIKPNGQHSVEDVLVLTNINRSEAGEYRCEASNQCGNASEATSIDVQYMPQITHISADQALNKDDRMSLNCTADGNPRPNITWTKVSDNSAVSFPLTITGKENEGQYRCTAQNGVGHTVSKVVSIIVHYPSSIEPLTNMTVEKGKSVTLFCNASGTPVPSVYWTHVSTGKQRLNRTWVLTDIKVDDLGEYKCHARNTFGNDSKSVSIYFAGGKCEVKCTDGTSCREWGQFLCLCNKGKKGPNCEQTDELKTTHTASLEITEEYNPVYEDLENAETKTFVKKIEDNVMEEFKDADIVSVKVTKLRKGSVIADMELTFNETAGESEVEALLSEATKDGKIGTLGVSQVAVGTIIKKPGDGKECGTFFQGEDCKKAKPALIALCVVGGLVVLAILVAIIAYILQRKKAQASINNGHYRAEPDGNPANGERNIGFNNHGNVNTAYENDRPNGESYVSDTPMVTFKSSNPAATPGIEINDSSVTK